MPPPPFSRALEEQIAEKNARKRQEVAEREEWERKKDAELGVMDYFGSGGGGAPLKGQGGTVVSDLRWSAVALSVLWYSHSTSVLSPPRAVLPLPR